MEDTKQKAKQWVDALRSGNYKQGRVYLFNGEGYCCLGVYAKEVMSCDDNLLYMDGYVKGSLLKEIDIRERVTDIYTKISREFGSLFICDLIEMNDKGKSFLEIADKIEQKYLLTE